VQLATVEPLAHAFDSDLQTASPLHLHEADPAVPVHVWRVLGHAAALPYCQHPGMTCVQVSIWAPEHCCCPCVQLLWQLDEQEAFPGSPPQRSLGATHI
jgi:hypothetical protein